MEPLDQLNQLEVIVIRVLGSGRCRCQEALPSSMKPDLGQSKMSWRFEKKEKEIYFLCSWEVQGLHLARRNYLKDPEQNPQDICRIPGRRWWWASANQVVPGVMGKKVNDWMENIHVVLHQTWRYLGHVIYYHENWIQDWLFSIGHSRNCSYKLPDAQKAFPPFRPLYKKETL